MVTDRVVMRNQAKLSRGWGTVAGETKGDVMPKLVKLLIILAIAVGIGVGVAKLNEQRQKFLAMSEEEQRAFLADKFGRRVPEDKLADIQNAVISAVNGRAAG
jgi:hypothetical protein